MIFNSTHFCHAWLAIAWRRSYPVRGHGGYSFDSLSWGESAKWYEHRRSISRSESAIKSVVYPKKRKWRRWRQIQIRRWKMFVKSLGCKWNDFRQRLHSVNLDCIWFILNKPWGANYKGTQALFAETKGNWMLCSAMSKSAETMVCWSFRGILMWISSNNVLRHFGWYRTIS